MPLGFGIGFGIKLKLGENVYALSSLTFIEAVAKSGNSGSGADVPAPSAVVVSRV